MCSRIFCFTTALLSAATVLSTGCHSAQPTPLPAIHAPSTTRTATGDTPEDHAPPTTRAASGETLDDIQALWTELFVKKMTGTDYQTLQKVCQRPRGEAFAGVVAALAGPINRGEITANLLLDLLGRPDLWLHAADGEVFLVYFSQSAGGIKWEDMFHVDADGYVRTISGNRVGVNVYGPEWHRN